MGKGRITLRGVALAALVVAGVACGSSGGTTSPSTAGGTTPSTVTPTTAPVTDAVTTTVAPTTVSPNARYYLSVGDSYASGYQPGIGNSTAGFAYQVAAASQKTSHPLQLVNVGCAGATTTSVLEAKGCAPIALGPGAAPYDDETQLEAAETFLRAHPGKVDLITVSLGGNDATRCSKATNAVSCVGAAVGRINANLPTIAQRLRAAAGPDAVLLGLTYPDVILGMWVSGAPSDKQLATLSVTAFKSLINPALSRAYATAKGQFVDVTAATGAYGPLTELTNLPPYGTIPVPVAKVCQLTHFCAQRDIHPNDTGYKLIAGLVELGFAKASAAGN